MVLLVVCCCLYPNRWSICQRIIEEVHPKKSRWNLPGVVVWTKNLGNRKNAPAIYWCTHRWFSSNTRRTGRGEKTGWCPLGLESSHHHTVCKPQESSDNLGGKGKYYPIPSKRLHRSALFGSKKNKAVHNSMWKWKRKPISNWSTEAQARAYFKGVYGIVDDKRDLFHEMGVANNVVMQEKMVSLAAKNSQMKQIWQHIRLSMQSIIM